MMDVDNQVRYDWDGVPMKQGIEQPVRRGYCPHSQLLFAIWHRPYMLLFEVHKLSPFCLQRADLLQQKLQSIAIDIANRFPDSFKSKYQDAAQKLRLPYWDWARTIPGDEPMFPAIFATEKVQITFPNTSVAEVDNPLFDYDFHPLTRSEINSTVSRNSFNFYEEPSHTAIGLCIPNRWWAPRQPWQDLQRSDPHSAKSADRRPQCIQSRCARDSLQAAVASHSHWTVQSYVNVAAI